MGYVFTLQNFLLLEKRDFERKEDIKAISYFSGFLVAVLAIPIFIFIPIVDHLRELRNINSLGYLIALGGLIIGGLVFLFEAREISIETLNYFARPITRFNTDIKKVKKYLVISTLVILFLSSDFETFRGHWVMWGESIIAFLIYVVILFKFGQILFMPSVSRTQRPSKIYLPSIKSKKIIIMLSTFLGLYLTILFIALSH